MTNAIVTMASKEITFLATLFYVFFLTSATGLDYTSKANVTIREHDSWFGWCGNTHYYGQPKPNRAWDVCVAFCEELELEAGLTYYLADALEEEEWSCVKEMMTVFKDEFRPDKVNHYWLGGSRNADGEIKWLSGEPLTFTDWRRPNAPRTDPYIHVTGTNEFQWNTKDDTKDKNNGCVCKSYQQ